jgi:Fe-S cluster assembly scaffold protein SufB
MEITVNKPLAETFGWLQAGAKRIDLQDKIQNISYVLGPGESRVLFLEDPGASEYEITLGEGARLDLVQLREASGKDLSYNNVRVTCGDKAYFGWYRVVLGGAESYDNCSVTLAGKESSFAANVCYRLDGTEKYDLNCEAIHTGKRTESAISASGVLADRASKLMRGTIDFRTGCSGSVGNETEDVLLLSEEVRNQSVPVILCSEEDVVGNHGASIGRPDEDMLFYMETRGVDEETACEMLARAKIDSVIRKIPDESIREKIWARVQRGE